uniref:Uncharacterized protein n=1 Tax=Arundo donax TaxID=35708 RepID=A0A0A9DBW7_ARUDO
MLWVVMEFLEIKLPMNLRRLRWTWVHLLEVKSSTFQMVECKSFGSSFLTEATLVSFVHLAAARHAVL